MPYPIPADATAGELLRHMRHHPNRPGHPQVIAAGVGSCMLVRQIHDRSSRWLDHDPVLAVKGSLVGDFVPAKPEHGTDLDLRSS